MKRPKRAVLLVVVALVAAACSNDSQADEASGTVDESGGSQSPAASDAPTDVHVLPGLSTATDVAEPGATITVSGDSRLSGEVVLVGPDGDLASALMSGGSASLSIPIGLDPGRYGLRLGDGEALGVVTVMNAPGLAVLGTGFVRLGEAAQVEVIVHGLGA